MNQFLVLTLIFCTLIPCVRLIADETNAPVSYEKQLLKSILADADANKDNPEMRKKYLNEFLTRSSTMSGLLEETNIWILRAAAAIELDYPSEGWIAGKQLKRFELQNSDNQAGIKVFTALDRKSWLRGEFPSRDWRQWKISQVQVTAEAGDVESMLALGSWYYNGYAGLPNDHNLAIDWWRRAADQANSTAQFRLGNIYSDGEDVARNFTESAKWMNLSASQGDDRAQFFLASMYESGVGVLKDKNEAIKWYSLAASAGDKTSVDQLKRLESNEKLSVIKVVITNGHAFYQTVQPKSN